MPSHVHPAARLAYAVLLLTLGALAGWQAHERWGGDAQPTAAAGPYPLPPPEPRASATSERGEPAATPSAPAQAAHPPPAAATRAPAPSPARTPTPSRASLAALLAKGAYDEAVARYEDLQANGSATDLERARRVLLEHAEGALRADRPAEAERLLRRFLRAEYRAVDARELLARALTAQDQRREAITVLYEAKGYAYLPEDLKRLDARIGAAVSDYTRTLQARGDHAALLELYRYLTQVQPDYAPYFIGLARTHLALDDRESARQALYLVVHDPGVGARARALLEELSAAVAAPVRDARAPRSAEAGLAKALAVPLTRHRDQFLVDARLDAGPTVRLLIDTGASMTVLRPQALARAGISAAASRRMGVFHTANGRVTAPVVRVDALSVGGQEVGPLWVGALDVGGMDGSDGLLGMDFLKHFRFFVDQPNAVLRLSPGHAPH